MVPCHYCIVVVVVVITVYHLLRYRDVVVLLFVGTCYDCCCDMPLLLLFLCHSAIYQNIAVRVDHCHLFDVTAFVVRYAIHSVVKYDSHCCCCDCFDFRYCCWIVILLLLLFCSFCSGDAVVDAALCYLFCCFRCCCCDVVVIVVVVRYCCYRVVIVDTIVVVVVVRIYCWMITVLLLLLVLLGYRFCWLCCCWLPCCYCCCCCCCLENCCCCCCCCCYCCCYCTMLLFVTTLFVLCYLPFYYFIQLPLIVVVVCLLLLWCSLLLMTFVVVVVVVIGCCWCCLLLMYWLLLLLRYICWFVVTITAIVVVIVIFVVGDCYGTLLLLLLLPLLLFVVGWFAVICCVVVDLVPLFCRCYWFYYVQLLLLVPVTLFRFCYCYFILGYCLFNVLPLFALVAIVGIFCSIVSQPVRLPISQRYRHNNLCCCCALLTVDAGDPYPLRAFHPFSHLLFDACQARGDVTFVGLFVTAYAATEHGVFRAAINDCCNATADTVLWYPFFAIGAARPRSLFYRWTIAWTLYANAGVIPRPFIIREAAEIVLFYLLVFVAFLPVLYLLFVFLFVPCSSFICSLYTVAVHAFGAALNVYWTWRCRRANDALCGAVFAACLQWKTFGGAVELPYACTQWPFYRLTPLPFYWKFYFSYVLFLRYCLLMGWLRAVLPRACGRYDRCSTVMLPTAVPYCPVQYAFLCRRCPLLFYRYRVMIVVLALLEVRCCLLIWNVPRYAVVRRYCSCRVVACSPSGLVCGLVSGCRDAERWVPADIYCCRCHALLRCSVDFPLLLPAVVMTPLLFFRQKKVPSVSVAPPAVVRLGAVRCPHVLFIRQNVME